MKTIQKILISAAVAMTAAVGTAEACTSVIVSGRVTKDGRPIIFKNRDTNDLDNLTVIEQGSRYRFVAIVGVRDLRSRNVWSGHNEAGFAIINTAAYNLNPPAPQGRQQGGPTPGATSGGRRGPDGQTSSESDGNIMKRALSQCATLKEFEQMLDSLPRPLRCNSNFGVLDAEGGCAYYEVGNEGYKKYDANDASQAPYGYLIRTNHGLSGDRSQDKGVERYMAISDFMIRADFTGHLDWEYLLRNIPRYPEHGLTKLNFYDFQPDDNRQPRFFPFRDFIPRYQTASAVLVQGVAKGELASNTVSWTFNGSPLTTVPVPLVITSSGKLPSLLLRNDEGYSTLTHWGLELKEHLFPLKRGNGPDYIDLAQLVNRSGTGILQLLEPVENEVINRGKNVLSSYREKQKAAVLDEYYTWVDDYLKEQYTRLFALK